MWELLPETWHLDTTSINCCHDRHPRRGFVTDNSLRIECFATLAAVLSICYPDKAPQFMRTIVCASWNFEGPAWATYDMAGGKTAIPRLGDHRPSALQQTWVESRPSLAVGTVYQTAMQAATARMPQMTLSSTVPSPRIAPLQLLWLKYAGCSTGPGEASADTNIAAMPS